MKFMGHDFENREQLVKAFPAFRGDDAWRAISRGGATTPMEVEVFCWKYRNRTEARERKARRLNSAKAEQDARDGRVRRRAA